MFAGPRRHLVFPSFCLVSRYFLNRTRRHLVLVRCVLLGLLAGPRWPTPEFLLLVPFLSAFSPTLVFKINRVIGIYIYITPPVGLALSFV